MATEGTTGKALLALILTPTPAQDWPDGATHKAMDADGSWWFYFTEPVPAMSGRWVGRFGCQEFGVPAHPSPQYPNWRESLINRQVMQEQV